MLWSWWVVDRSSSSDCYFWIQIHGQTPKIAVCLHTSITTCRRWTERLNSTEFQSEDPTFEGSSSSSKPYLINQCELNNQFVILIYSKNRQRFWVHSWNAGISFSINTKICQKEFQDFYSKENCLVDCNNICGVMFVLDYTDCSLTLQKWVWSLSFCIVGMNLHAGSLLK